MCRLKSGYILLIQLLNIDYAFSSNETAKSYDHQNISCSDERFESDINKQFLQNLECSMNINADPCEDFYEYACGNWTDDNPFDKILNNMFEKLKLDDREAETSLNEAYKKALVYYNTCRSICCYDATEFLKLVEPTAQQNWPLYKRRTSNPWNFENFVWWKVLAKLQSYTMQLIFDIDATIVPEKSDLYIIKIEKNKKKDIINLSKDYLVDMGYNTSVERKLFIWKLQAYEKKLQNIIEGKNDPDKRSNESVCNVEKSYEVIKSDEFDNDTELMNLNELQLLLPGIDWPTYFDIYFQGTNIKLSENVKLFIVYNIDVLRSLMQFLENSSKETLALYLMTNFLSHMDSTMPDLSEKTSSCAASLESLMPLVANRLYEDYYYGPTRAESDQVINNIFENLKTILNDLFEQNRLNLTTKEIDYLKRKSQKMRLNIGNLPENKTIQFLIDYYANLNINTGHNIYHIHLELLRQKNLQKYRVLIADHTNQTNVFRTFIYNAGPLFGPHYSAEDNLIVIPFDYLKFPFHHYKSHDIFQSTTRFALSHEMIHGFDTYGIKLDDNGKYNTFMENIGKKKSYMNGVECLKKDITAGIDERISDVVGMRLSIAKFFNKIPINAQTLGERSTTLSYRKIFFVKIWQYFCKKDVEELVDLTKDTHDPPDYRMVYALANTREFLDEFKCTKEMTPISSEGICQLW